MVLLPFAMVRVIVQSVLRRGNEHVDVDERKDEDEETADRRRISEEAESEGDWRVEFLTTGGIAFLERFSIVVVVVVDESSFVSARGCRRGGASSLRSFFTSLSSSCWMDVEFV